VRRAPIHDLEGLRDCLKSQLAAAGDIRRGWLSRCLAKHAWHDNHRHHWILQQRRRLLRLFHQ
jgi:hypothetical protein